MLLPLVATLDTCARGLKTEELLPLDGAGGFAGDVVADAVDTVDFVDDAAGDGLEQGRG